MSPAGNQHSERAIAWRRGVSWRPVLLGAVAVAMAAGCSRSGPAGAKAATAAEPARAVDVTPARVEAWPTTVRVQGSLLADDDAVIGSKLDGRVERVHVDLGAVVRRGDPLVELDQVELRLLVAQAEAQLRQACSAIGLTPEDDETALVLENAPPVMLESALVDEARAAVARADRLRPSNAITESEYDTFVAQLKTAEARRQSAINGVREQVSLIGVRRADLALARQQLADARIVAPFDALVDARRVSPGAYVQPGQPVVSLVRVDRLRFTAGVPERHAAAIRMGQPAALRVTGIGAPIPAEISRVSPTVVQSSRSVRIEIDVANPELALQAGMFGEADVTIDSAATTLVVPVAAVRQFAGVHKAWVVANGQSQQRTVRVGRRDAGRWEILDGLAPGELVVRDAAQAFEGPATIRSAGGDSGEFEEIGAAQDSG